MAKDQLQMYKDQVFQLSYYQAMNIFLTFVLKSKLGLKEEEEEKKKRISLTLLGFFF